MGPIRPMGLMEVQRMNRARLMVETVLAIVAMAVFTGILLFATAGTVHYWQAWAYLAAFFIPSTVGSLYFVMHDPELIRRRMRTHEPELWQQIGQGIVAILYYGVYIIAGLDHRYGWSHVPTWLAIASDVLIVAGFIFIFRVFQENRYAGSTVQVEEGQQVVSTGPYAVVRHPMYIGAFPLLALTPLALGTYWGLLASLLMVVWLILRILNEEAVLVRDLPGYDEYRRKVRWRLIPGVW